jgi:phosphoglycolate phosphatase
LGLCYKSLFMLFKGLIFDLDGTMADTLADIAGSMNYVLSANGFPAHPVTAYKEMVGKGLDNLVLQALPPKERQPATLSGCLSEMIDYYNDNCLVKTHLYDNMHDVLVKLTEMKMKLAVFSNKSEPLTQKIVGQLAGDIPFVRIMGASPEIPRKPDPTGAKIIAIEMGILPHDIVYVGDSDVDMKTASLAEMYAVGVRWGYRSKEELLVNGAKIVIQNPGELLKIISNISAY